MPYYPPGGSGIADLSATSPLSGGGTGSVTVGLGTLTNFGAAGQLIRSSSSSALAWTTATYPATTVAGDLLHSSTTNTITGLTAVAIGQVLISGGVGVAPSYSDAPRIARLGIGTAAGATTELTITQPVRTTGSPTLVTFTGGCSHHTYSIYRGT